MTAKSCFIALLASTGLAPIIWAAPVAAQAAVAVDVNVPAQDLGPALASFARQADADIVYSPTLVAGRRSNTVAGRHDIANGLARLLSGTGLSLRRVGPKSFALQSGAPAPAPAAAADRAAPAAGTVTDAATGAALPGARISFAGTNLVAIADDRGRFYLPAVPLSATSVTVEYLGNPAATLPLPAAADARQRLALAVGDASGDIVVLAYNSSLQRALNQQLRADNNATVVASDLLGSFPAETVSDALRRLPGVAFGRDANTGEGQRITVRGFSSEAINIQLNGLDLQGTSFERSIDLSGFLTENIAQVTIQKSLLPSMQANGSGGLVEIETKSGLDYGDFAFNFGGETENGLDPQFGGEYQLNGTLAVRLASNLGVVGSVQYRRTDRTNFGADLIGVIPPVLPNPFTSIVLVPASRQFPFDDAINSRLETGVNYFRRDRSEANLTASLNFAWDVSPTTNLRLDLQRIDNDVATQTARVTAAFQTTQIANMPIPELGGTPGRRTTLANFRPTIGLVNTDIQTLQDSIALRGTTNLDRWQLKYKAGYSRARSVSNNGNVSLLGAVNTNLAQIIDPATIVTNPDAGGVQRVVGGGIAFLPNGLPVLSLTPLGASLLTDPAQYAMSTAARNLTDSPTTAYTGEASVRYLPKADWFAYVQVGGKYDRSTRRTADDLFATTTIGALRSVESYVARTGLTTPLTSFGDNFLDNGVLSGIGAGNFSVPFLRPAALEAIFAGLAGLTADNPATAFNENRFTLTDRRGADPVNTVGALIPTRTIEERRAGYVEAKFQLGQFDLIGGARFESMFRSGRSLSSPSIRQANGVQEPRDTFVNAGLVDFFDLSGTQNVLTPSAVVNFRPRDNLVARFAYFRSTVNPDFRLIRRTRSIFVDLRPQTNLVRITEANPDLRPTKTNNYDFDLSYYFTDSPGLIRAGFFYKTVQDNFTNVLFQPGSDTEVRDEVLAELAPLAAIRPELVAFNDATVYQRNRPENGAGGKIYGVELELIRQLNFLPGFLKDFGVLGNLTWTKGDFPTLLSGRNDDGTIGQFSFNRPLGDQSQWVYNASLTYARDGFDARVIYTRQSASADVYNIHGIDEVVPAYATLDARLSYNFNHGGSSWTIYLQGDDLLRGSKNIDLTRAFASQFNGNGSDFFFPDTYLFGGGRTITAGFRARF